MAPVDDTGAADTVIVTAALDGRFSVAVTVDTFDAPLSSIVDGDNASVASGNASSSVMVSVTLDGAATPLPPAAVAETVTDLSGASVALSVAVIVTVPALVVEPAAIVNVFALDSVKSVPDPGDADTVSVTAALDGRFSVAVTVDTFDAPLSSIDDADNASATSGNASSSVMVSVTLDGAATPVTPGRRRRDRHRLVRRVGRIVRRRNRHRPPRSSSNPPRSSTCSHSTA